MDINIILRIKMEELVKYNRPDRFPYNYEYCDYDEIYKYYSNDDLCYLFALLDDYLINNELVLNYDENMVIHDHYLSTCIIPFVPISIGIILLNYGLYVSNYATCAILELWIKHSKYQVYMLSHHNRDNPNTDYVSFFYAIVCLSVINPHCQYNDCKDSK